MTENVIDNLAKLLECEVKIASSRKTPKRYQPITATNDHPFDDFYRRYVLLNENEKIMSMEVQKYRVVAASVDAIKDLEGFERVLEDLKVPTKYTSIVTEVLCAKKMLDLKRDIFFPGTRDSEGIKTPDIIWKKDNVQIPIECKKIKSFNSSRDAAEKQWPDISNRILQELHRKTAIYDVYVRFEEIPTKPEIDSVIANISSAEVTPEWKQIAKTVSYELWMKHGLVDASSNIVEDIPTIANFEKTFVQQFVSVESGRWFDKIMIALELNQPRLSMNNFETLFKRAVSKIPEDGPGIVAIGIPFPNQDDIMAYLKWLTDQFDKRLFTRVNEVHIIWIAELFKRELYKTDYINVPFPCAAGCVIKNAYANSKI